MFEDKAGMPKFLGVERTAEGFARNGYPIALGRSRAYSGCHWSAIPGREYTMNDCVKINFAAVFEYTLKEALAERASALTVASAVGSFCLPHGTRRRRHRPQH